MLSGHFTQNPRFPAECLLLRVLLVVLHERLWDRVSVDSGAMMAGESKGMPTKTDQKRGSYKPAAVQALVIEGRKSGHSMRRIARDSGLDRSTVKNILSQPEIEMALQQSRGIVLSALPAISQMVTADILKERDRELGFRVLKRAGIFPKEVGQKSSTVLQDNRLQIAIQTLLPPPPHRSHPAERGVLV